MVLGDNPNNLTHLAAAQEAGLNVFAYGNFLTVLINFLLLAWVVFLLVKFMNKLRRKEEEAAPAPEPTPEDIALLREIRDELKRKG